MRKSISLAARQRGFSVLSGMILAIIMLGSMAFFLAGQGVNTTFGATYSNSSKVSGLLASAGYINAGFDSVALNGTPLASVTFDSTTTTGMFNPSTGGAAPQSLDPTLFGRSSSLDGYWIYRKNEIALNTVGTASAEYTIMLSGLKQAICQQINTTLRGSSTIPVLTINDATLVGTTVTSTSPTSVLGASVDLGLAASFSPAVTTANPGWLNGCYASATASNYVYIHTLLAQ